MGTNLTKENAGQDETLNTSVRKLRKKIKLKMLCQDFNAATFGLCLFVGLHGFSFYI